MSIIIRNSHYDAAAVEINDVVAAIELVVAALALVVAVLELKIKFWTVFIIGGGCIGLIQYIH